MSEIKHLSDDSLQLDQSVQPDSEQAAGLAIDYRRVLDAAKRYFWVIILYLIAGLSAATVYLVNATPIYRSVSRLKIEQRVMTPGPNGQSMDPIEDLRGSEMLQTIQLGFVSRALMERMVERLSLKTRGDFTKSTPIEGEVDDEAYIQYLMENTEVQLIQGTRLMTISFEHPDPHVAQEIVDAMVQEYKALESQQRLDSASVNLSYLIEESRTLKQNLTASEQKLVDYIKSEGNVSVEDNGVNIITARLVELNTRLGAATADRLKLESDSEQISKSRDDPKALLEISSVADLPEITSLRSQLNTLDGDISKVARKYKPGNPQLLQLQSQRESLQKALNAEVLRAPQTVDRTLQAAIQNQAALKRATEEAEKSVIDTKSLSIQAKALERQASVDNDAYMAMQKKYIEEVSQTRSQPVFIQVVDPASPAFKVKPKALQTLAIATFLSLLASCRHDFSAFKS